MTIISLTFWHSIAFSFYAMPSVLLAIPQKENLNVALTVSLSTCLEL